MSENEKRRFELTKLQTAFAIICGMIVLGISTMGTFWDFRDKMDERERLQIEKEQIDQAELNTFMIVKAMKPYFDSINAEHNKRYDRYSNQINRKDSILLIVLPKFARTIGQTNAQIKKLNSKFDVFSESQTGELDFVEILNKRDSINAERIRSDSLDMVLLREIRKANKKLYENIPKFGDRAQ